MRNFVLRLATIAGVLFTLGACADSLTESNQEPAPDLPAATSEAEPDCVVGGVCLLPPERGGWCDPYEELDWSCDDGGGGDCMTSVPDPTGPEEAAGVQSCVGTGGGGGGGSGDESGEESTICPQPFIGNVQPALITVAGRNHEFQFHSSLSYPFKRLTGGRSPATYEIGLPTTSRDTWWIAERGTITVWCRGAWITKTHWVGTLTIVDSDLHMVMGPGHPDF